MISHGCAIDKPATSLFHVNRDLLNRVHLIPLLIPPRNRWLSQAPFVSRAGLQPRFAWFGVPCQCEPDPREWSGTLGNLGDIPGCAAIHADIDLGNAAKSRPGKSLDRLPS